jgi:hypothetical protein
MVITVETIRPKSSTRRKIIEIASIFAFIIIVEFWAGDETVRLGARYMIWGAKYMYRWAWGLPPPPF